MHFKESPHCSRFVFICQELVARFVLLEDRNRSSLVHRMLPHYPALTALVAAGNCCELCLNPFLTTWLECVHFISPKKVQEHTHYNAEMNM